MTIAFHASVDATDLPIEDIPEALTQDGDWDDVLHEIEAITSGRIVVSLGSVHPTTHSILCLILKLDDKKVRETRVDTGYLHTGIEKNMEYRTWVQGVAYCTCMDYVAPFFQEAAYYLDVEKLLGIEEDIPERASLIRILMMELCHIASYPVAISSTDNEMGATTIMTIGFRVREEILRIFERITGLRMNHEYIRLGGIVQDIGEGTVDYIRDRLRRIRKDIGELQDILVENPIFKKRLCDVAVMPLNGLVALGTTGPGVCAVGLPLDLHKSQPYCGYENFEFDVPIRDESDVYNRTMTRSDECYKSIRIIRQVLTKLDQCKGAPTMVIDPEIAWSARLTVGTDGQGNSTEHVREIMREPTESLTHYFKPVTEGFHVPASQVCQTVEHAKSILGVHLIPDDGTRPFRAHFRDPSYANLQALAVMTEGGQLADVVIALVAINPALGGVGR